MDTNKYVYTFKKANQYVRLSAWGTFIKKKGFQRILCHYEILFASKNTMLHVVREVLRRVQRVY